MAAGGSVGACGGGDALPTRPVQVHIGVGVTCYVVHVTRLFMCSGCGFFLTGGKGASLLLSAWRWGDVCWMCCARSV